MSNLDRVSGGPIPCFSGGWAIIPLCETGHYWSELKPVIGRPREVRFWESLCGRASATSDSSRHPLALGNFSGCKICRRMQGEAA